VLCRELQLNTHLPYLKISQILKCAIKANLINLLEYNISAQKMLYYLHFSWKEHMCHKWERQKSDQKVKYSYPITSVDRPLVLQEFEDPRISRQSAHEGDKVISLTHRPPLPPRRYPWCSFLLVPSTKYTQKKEVHILKVT